MTLRGSGDSRLLAEGPSDLHWRPSWQQRALDACMLISPNLSPRSHSRACLGTVLQFINKSELAAGLGLAHVAPCPQSVQQVEELLVRSSNSHANNDPEQ